MKEKLSNGNLRIEEYSFHEFLSSFAEAISDGYSMDLTQNETFPQKYGDYLTIVMVPVVAAPVVFSTKQQEMLDAVTEPIPVEVIPAKTRKAKAQ